MTEPETHVPKPWPPWPVLAAATPSLLVALLEVLRELGAWVPQVAAETLALLWLFTTLPALFVLWGLRAAASQPGGEGGADLGKALDAIARAEQVAVNAGQTQALVEALLRERAERGAAEGSVPRAAARRSAVLAAVVTAGFLLAAGGLAYAFVTAPAPPRPVHIHPAFAVFAEGERIAFEDPAFDLAARGTPRAHLHVNDTWPGIFHLEGPPGVTLAEAFDWGLASTLTEDALVLDGAVHGGRAFREDATHRVRLFVAPAGGDAWREVKPVTTYVPQDHDRLLLSFGNSWGPALDAERATVPARFPG